MSSRRIRLWQVALALMLLVAAAMYVRHQLRLRAAIASVLDSVRVSRDNDLGGAPEWPMPPHPPELRWEVWREGDALVVAYEVLNATDEAIWLYDVPQDAPDEIFAYAGEELGLAVLFRGCYVIHGFAGSDVLFSGPRRVLPGEVVTGLARRVLPLQADVIRSWLGKVGETARRVRLEIAWTRDEGEPSDLLLAPEPPFKLYPHYGRFHQRWLVSEPVELP